MGADESKVSEVVPRVVGVIAQEMSETCPEIVRETPDGFLTVAYADMVPIVVEALKKHHRDLNTLATMSDELAELQKAFKYQLRTLSTALKRDKSEPEARSRTHKSEVPQAVVGAARKSLMTSLNQPKSTAKSNSAKGGVLTRALNFVVENKWKVAGIGVGVLGLILIIMLAVMVPRAVSGVPSAPAVLASPPAAPGRIQFNTTNFFSNPDFEDPSEFPKIPGWNGTYALAEYSNSFVLGQLKTSAPFNAGKYYLSTETSPASPFVSASTVFFPQNVLNLSPTINASVWAAMLSSSVPGSSVTFRVSVFTSSSAAVPECDATMPVEIDNFDWQCLRMVLQCNLSAPVYLIKVELTAEGQPTAVVWDHARIAFVSSPQASPPPPPAVLPIDLDYDPGQAPLYLGPAESIGARSGNSCVFSAFLNVHAF